MTQQKKQDSSDSGLSKLERNNARFEQEVADSRDHDKQSGKDEYQKRPMKSPRTPSKKS